MILNSQWTLQGSTMEVALRNFWHTSLFIAPTKDSISERDDVNCITKAFVFLRVIFVSGSWEDWSVR